MDWRKIAPWNWLRKEQERGNPATAVRSADPLIALRDEMDRAFGDVFRRVGGRSPWLGLAEAPALLRPSVDISEGRKSYTVRVEVPGVEKGDVVLHIEDDSLLIRGEKKQEKEESEEGYHCIERSYGVFERVLSLPEDADSAGIQAKFRNGILKITIPKRAVPDKEGRTIEIHHE
jgi:HSP20 family protein